MYCLPPLMYCLQVSALDPADPLFTQKLKSIPKPDLAALRVPEPPAEMREKVTGGQGRAVMAATVYASSGT